MNPNLTPENWRKVVAQLIRVIAVLVIALIAVPIIMTTLIYRDYEAPASGQNSAQTASQPSSAPAETAKFDPYERDFNVSSLGDSDYDKMVKYGYELIAKTAEYIGPKNGDPKMIYAGNNLACKNCHLDAGTKKFSAPYIGVTGRFPQYRGRENTIGSIEERINGCMERSMNGKRLPVDGKEMRAMVAYMSWLGNGVPAGEKVDGTGFLKIKIPERAVDLERGKLVYEEKCQSCHMADGQGVLQGDGPLYTYPPLWGNDTYNHGAGMHRVLTAAQFIKGNMPFGATGDNPMISDEDAYDVAGFINNMERAQKAQTERDFPDLKRKPVSTPYGPWADDFSAEQHKFGPFQPIMAFYEKEFGLKKTK